MSTSYEEYKEIFKNLIDLLKSITPSPDTDAIDYSDSVWLIKLEVRKNIFNLCSSIEAKIKADINESLEFFNKYNDFSQMERATFLGLANSVIKLIALKIIYCSDELLGDFWAEVQNLVFATDLMICERDGKSKRSLIDNV